MRPVPGAAPRAAAFFDVDRTLVDGASALVLLRAAHAVGILSARDLLPFAREGLRFRLLGERIEALEDLGDRAMRLLAGCSAVELQALAAPVVARLRPRIRPAVRDRLIGHREAGCETWLISASPDFVVQELSRSVGATGAVGSTFEVEDGRLTGRLRGPAMHGPVKALAAEALVAERGLAADACWAYGDSIHDLPLLAAVGTPVAVHPDRRLHAHARAAGWEVLGSGRRPRAARSA